MVADSGSNRFSGELRVALHASGLTLDAVQRRLSERGFVIGRSTLSYWQNGHRLPTQPTSLLAVTALEEILKVPTGSFTDALRHPAATTVSSELDMATASARIGALMEGVGCPDGIAALEPLSTIQIAEYGATGCLRSVRAVETYRALVDTERFPILHGGEPGGSPDLIRHEAVSGGRIGRVRRDPETNIVVSELVFDRYVRRGEHHFLHYRTFDDNEQRSLLLYRLVVSPRSMMVIDLGFHPDCLPVRLEEYERAIDNGPDLFVRQRTLSPDRRVTLVRERARRGIVGLRWEYA